jgi:hypothetical protein
MFFLPRAPAKKEFIQAFNELRWVAWMWMRINGKDVDNSNTEQIIIDRAATIRLGRRPCAAGHRCPARRSNPLDLGIS